jgi:hypothetical protein
MFRGLALSGSTVTPNLKAPRRQPMTRELIKLTAMAKCAG